MTAAALLLGLVLGLGIATALFGADALRQARLVEQLVRADQQRRDEHELVVTNAFRGTQPRASA